MLKTLSLSTAVTMLAYAALPHVPAVADNAAPHFSIAPVRAFPGETGGPMKPVDGSSMLIRTGKGAAFALDTRGLEPGAAYTAWWVVFNAPQNCATPHDCKAADLDVASVEPGVLYASGRVADENGQARFAANLDYGVSPTGDDQVPNSKRANPMSPDAEIHIVLRTHGAAFDDMAARERQLSEFNGGCPESGCYNVQASAHHSPTAAMTSSGS